MPSEVLADLSIVLLHQIEYYVVIVIYPFCKKY